MTDKPRQGIVNTPFRLTEEDLRRIDVVRKHFCLWDRADVFRMALDELYRRTEREPPLEKIPEKYVRPT